MVIVTPPCTSGPRASAGASLAVIASPRDNCPPSLRAPAKRGRSNPEAARQPITPPVHDSRAGPPGLLRPLRGLAMTVETVLRHGEPARKRADPAVRPIGQRSLVPDERVASS